MSMKINKYSRNQLCVDGKVKNKLIKSQLKRIAEEYKLRLSSARENIQSTVNENHHNFLQREIYWLGREIYKKRKNWDSQAFVAKVRPGSMTRPDKQDDNFRALFNSLPGNLSLYRQLTSKWTMNLNYANKHNVPAKYLCGFLLQSGPERVRKENMDKPNYFEPGFRDKTTIKD